jgi:hypothetical protein
LKRLGVTVATVAMMVVMTAGQALAQYPPSKPPPGGGPGQGGVPSVPFTGTNITLGVVILVALLVVGTMLLLLGRRRRVRASS